MLKIICIKSISWDRVIDAFAHQKIRASGGNDSCCAFRVVGLVANGRPLFAMLGDVAFKLTAGFSEVEEVPRKKSASKAHQPFAAATTVSTSRCSTPPDKDELDYLLSAIEAQ